jgi:hypothetical protein
MADSLDIRSMLETGYFTASRAKSTHMFVTILA